MRIAALRVATVLVALAAAAPAVAQSDALPAKSYGPSFSLPPDPGGQAADAASGRDVSEYDLSLGCIVGGSAGTALSMSAGGMNVVNLIAGGLVPATSPVAMWVALGGVVFASFCSVGQALTPAVLATYSYFVPPEPVLGGPTMDARYCQIAEPLAPSGTAPPERSLPVRFTRGAAERM